MLLDETGEDEQLQPPDDVQRETEQNAIEEAMQEMNIAAPGTVSGINEENGNTESI